MLILIGGQKGGGGKTTTATNLATMFVLDKRDVLLYDIDPQRTATLWAYFGHLDEMKIVRNINYQE